MGNPQPTLVHRISAMAMAILRGRTTKHASKKGSEKVLGRVLWKGSQKGCENGGPALGFTLKKGFWEGVPEGVLRRGFPEKVLRRGFPEGA